MPYSKKQKIIFFHIPKNAGCSINNALNLALNKKLIFPKLIYESHNNYIKEACATRLINTLNLNINEYFKFAFVRNPYDRIVSGWKYGQKICKIRASFEEFIKNLSKFRKYDSILWHTIISQTTHVSYNKKIITDFIGKVENINNDLKIIERKLKITFPKIPKLNTTAHNHWSTYYTKELKNIVYNKFKQDFINFNYER